MAPRRLRLKSLTAGWGPLKADVEIREGDRALLHPLFVTLRDRRAILYSPRGRMDQRYIALSIEDVRARITETLTQLGPDSEAAVWLEKMRVACREFLDAIASTRNSPQPDPDLQPALHQLRDMVRTVANHVSAVYRLPSAAALVQEMNDADKAAAHIEAGVVAGVVDAREVTGRVAGNSVETIGSGGRVDSSESVESVEVREMSPSAETSRRAPKRP